MWYFCWLLGMPFAATFSILNAMWYEVVENKSWDEPLE
ncbi:hypothetical protein B488_01460 [Liberibacter crescens BT-1]|uniref:Cyd operon protein YbgT n=1 Tax=Liberibacter crescens (strain BT-1) TaxID=1215343 RepID=L0ERM4_LIBCB|nr:cytochrome bd-I oxidase subunit CydX [Liberibacter crescens]AGA64139.1 hypothetical protein B488_01460 [Liberibacter crescens BT-1]AMC12410.1 cytochrome bd biosynthesis protein [Liberibacter crescens]